MNDFGHVHHKSWRIEWMKIFDGSYNFYLALDEIPALSSKNPCLSKHVTNTSDFQEGLDLCRNIVGEFYLGSNKAIEKYLDLVIQTEKTELHVKKQNHRPSQEQGEQRGQ